MRWFVSGCVAFVIVAGCAGAPGTWSEATLHGMVSSSTGSPIAGVLVSIEDGGSAVSDPNGRFTLPGTERAEITVSASADGYEPLRSRLAFSDRTQILHLVLLSASDLVAHAEQTVRHEQPVGTATSGSGEAYDLCIRALRVSPGDAVVRYRAALVLARTGAFGEALELLRWFDRARVPRAVELLRERIREEAK